MSEYWKSTPKYWCKHCKTFIRDTKLETQNHEATPRHQGNLQRFIRDLHRGNDRSEREKQRAKNEVDRLNGISNVDRLQGNPERQTALPAIEAGRRDVGPAGRKRQLAQLAEMGVAVPEEYRREMAMAGDWQTVSVTSASRDVESAKNEEEDAKASIAAFGIRKRKFEEQEHEQDGNEEGPRIQPATRAWGSATKGYPSAASGVDEDLDTLLQSTKVLKPDISGGALPKESGDGLVDPSQSPGNGSLANGQNSDGVTKSGLEADLSKADENRNPGSNGSKPAGMKENESLVSSGIVFKKRKGKTPR